jgi:hypothetical protein
MAFTRVIPSEARNLETPLFGPQYRSTQITVHRQFVIPAEAGIQAVFLDSGQKIAEMTL